MKVTELGLDVLVQLAVGSGDRARPSGWRAGAASWRGCRLPTGGLYPALTLALALLAFGVATLLQGSGFLAVYLAGLMLGNGASALPRRTPPGARRARLAGADRDVPDAGAAGASQSGSRRWPAPGLGLALLLAVVVRPPWWPCCLAPVPLSVRGRSLYIGWVGLRGAVPIVLATYPVLVGAPGAERIFHLVFFIVVVNALVPGATVAWVTRRLGLQAAEAPAPQAVLAIESRLPLRGRAALVSTSTRRWWWPGWRSRTWSSRRGRRSRWSCGATCWSRPRAPRCSSRATTSMLLAQPEDRALIQLMFGRPEEE